MLLRNNNNMRFEYLEHTADAKFKAFGRTLNEQFENCAYALFNIIVNTDDVKPITEHQISMKAKTIRGLRVLNLI